MKYLLYLVTLPAFSQTLTPAEPPTNWTELAIIGVIILLVAVAFIVHKRFPSASEKAAAAIQADLAALAHKGLDLAHKHADFSAAAKPSAATTEVAAYEQAMRNQDRANQLRKDADARIDADVAHVPDQWRK